MTDLAKDVRAAAKSVAREWPGVIEADDAEQEIWLHILEWSKGWKSLEDMAEQSRKRALRRIGHQVASEYRASYEVFSGNFHYGTQDVRRILEKQENPNDEGTEDPEIASPADTPGSETHTEQIDLSEGLERLRDKNGFYAKVIEGKFFYGTPHHKARVDLTRAVDALTECMNSAHKAHEVEYDSRTGLRNQVDEYSHPLGADWGTRLRKDVLAH